jgi:hypothetical protein
MPPGWQMALDKRVVLSGLANFQVVGNHAH